MLPLQFHSLFHIIPNCGSYIAAWTIGIERHSLKMQFHHTLYTGREEKEVCSFMASGLVKICDQDFYSLRDMYMRGWVSLSLWALHLLHLCNWVLSGKLLLVVTSTVIHRFESHGTQDHILLSNIWDSPNLEDKVPVFISPSERLDQLYLQALGSLFSPSTTSRATVEVF
jgi:hypothetical protein